MADVSSTMSFNTNTKLTGIYLEIYGCGFAAIRVINALEGIEGLPSHKNMEYNFMGYKSYRYCFRIPANGSDSRFDAISISVPPGSQFGRDIADIIDNPITEIALIKNEKLVFVDELGYDSVLQFFDFESLSEEVKRLISL
jgi:hypothetical protein